jgi:hypothetical protein
MPFGGDQRTDRELTTEMQETLAGQFAWLIREAKSAPVTVLANLSARQARLIPFLFFDEQSLPPRWGFCLDGR